MFLGTQCVYALTFSSGKSIFICRLAFFSFYVFHFSRLPTDRRKENTNMDWKRGKTRKLKHSSVKQNVNHKRTLWLSCVQPAAAPPASITKRNKLVCSKLNSPSVYDFPCLLISLSVIVLPKKKTKILKRKLPKIVCISYISLLIKRKNRVWETIS